MADWFQERFNLGVDKISLIVGNVCHRWGCRQHADDVAAEVMLRIYLRDCADPEYFTTTPIGRFICRDTWFMLMHLLRTTRHVEFRDPQQLPDPAYAPDDLEEERLLSLLADCDQAVKLLAGADRKVQEVFLLGCKGMKNEDIARKLSMSKATVKRRRQAALKHLKRTLSETDFGGPAHGGHQG